MTCNTLSKSSGEHESNMTKGLKWRCQLAPSRCSKEEFVSLSFSYSRDFPHSLWSHFNVTSLFTSCSLPCLHYHAAISLPPLVSSGITFSRTLSADILGFSSLNKRLSTDLLWVIPSLTLGFAEMLEGTQQLCSVSSKSSCVPDYLILPKH